MNWTVLEIEGVMDVVKSAALAVANHREYGEYVEYGDLEQESMFIASAMEEDVREAVKPDGDITLGAIRHRLVLDLIDKVKYDVQHRQKAESFEARYSEEFEDFSARAEVTTRRDGALYTRELVESLLPAVWDASYCYGMQAENAPDADMPRGSINKATGNTLGAHLVDIKVGWEKTDLTVKERRALFLMYCMDWTHHEIAYNQECSRQVITERIATAIGKIVARLNGVAWHNWEEVAA